MKPPTKQYAVPYTNLPLKLTGLVRELTAVFQSVITSGQYVMGPALSAFEQEFADYCQTKYAVGVSDGTSALYLVLRYLGLKEHDEVLTVPNSFVATSASIALAGGRPVYVDIGVDLNIDPDDIEKRITPRSRAILPVHLTGRPARMDRIVEIARRYNLVVIEDAAQAVGAALGNKPVGNWGFAGCFSFHPMKNLHAFGDGGMVTTNDDQLYDYLKIARNHGLRSRNQCNFWSHNARLDELQAALLHVMLRELDGWSQERRRLAELYNEALCDVADVPWEGPEETSVYHTYVIQVDQRDHLYDHLLQNGVEALIHYPTPLHLQPAAADLGYKSTDFPATMAASSRIISLPLFPGMTKAQQSLVIRLIRGFYKKAPSGAQRTDRSATRIDRRKKVERARKRLVQMP
jgi:dTDP-4-amino-4,6-dideoxygalactose transaminase